MRKLMPGESAAGASSQPEDDLSQGREPGTKGFRATIEQWQSTIDERIRAVLPSFAVFRELEAEIRRLSDRVESLEKRVDEALGSRDGKFKE